MGAVAPIRTFCDPCNVVTATLFIAIIRTNRVLGTLVRKAALHYLSV